MSKTPARSVSAAVVLLLAAHTADAQQTFSVVPGPVAWVPATRLADGRSVTGSFEFSADSAGIVTNRRGGACLVADLTAQGYGKRSCRTDVECNPVMRVSRTPGRPDAPSVAVPGYEGYCAKSHANPSAPRMCWVRPGAGTAYCTRSPTVDLVERRYELPRVAARPVAGAGVVRWRVLTCLNPPSVAGTSAPCAVRGAPGKQVLAGPILTIPR